MSEFSNSYFDTSAKQEAYNSAVQNATGASEQSADQFNKKLRKYEEDKEKANLKYENIKDVTTNLGVIPLEEAVRDTISKLSKKAKDKITNVISDKIGDKLDEATSKIKSVVSDKLKLGKSTLSDAQLPENYLQLPKVDANPDAVASSLAKRKKLSILKSQQKAKFNIDDNISSANNLTDDLGSRTLAKQREIMATPRHDAVQLSGNDVEDINPSSFFENSRGFQPQGELTKRSFENPFSIMNNKDALEGARAFKEFDTASARTQASRLGQSRIVKAPESTKSIMPKAKINDQLQPMRDLLKPESMNVDPQARLKSILPDLDHEGNIVRFYTPPDHLPPPKKNLLGQEKKTPAENMLGETKPTPTEDSLVTPVQDPIKDVAKVAPKAEEGVGKSIGGDLLKGVETMGEVDAETGGGVDFVGDIIGLAAGLGSIIGGIFHHHHHPAPPKPPPAPAIINPAPALGI